ncbi:MAG: YdcF family protein [Desulfuromonadaceae bacterium]|nr:YdcF family protein [Desulfuromonadaceae bacterium]MDD2849367.1 YdcF family protein [Desulfuromonadaceae bacterium]MDD4129426.1 YdcF family protein [Desulfuromonadaceae bacterium]
MNIIKAILTLCIIGTVVIAVLFIDFTYKTFSYRQNTQKVDAIVVLAGGKGRVEEGVRLFRESRAEHLFFIGVDPSVIKSDLYRPKHGDPSADKVVLEKASRNTLENSIFGRDLIVRSGIHSVLLITSRYHLKRASILFRNSLPRDVTIIPYPVDSVNLKESWWNHGGSFQLLFREFYKYCMFRAFFLLAPEELRQSVLPTVSGG